VKLPPTPSVALTLMAYQVLLHLYPRSYRRTFGKEMTANAAWHCHTAHRQAGTFGVLRWGVRLLGDTLRTAPGERVESFLYGQGDHPLNTHYSRVQHGRARVRQASLLMGFCCLLLFPATQLLHAALQGNAPVFEALAAGLVLVVLAASGTLALLVARHLYGLGKVLRDRTP